MGYSPSYQVLPKSSDLCTGPSSGLHSASLFWRFDGSGRSPPLDWSPIAWLGRAGGGRVTGDP
jgi:hypothetical protein